MTVPIRGQYEQQCNAAALKQLGITTLAGIDEYFPNHFLNWINNAPVIQKDYSHTIPQCLAHIFTIAATKTVTSLLAEEVY